MVYFSNILRSQQLINEPLQPHNLLSSPHKRHKLTPIAFNTIYNYFLLIHDMEPSKSMNIKPKMDIPSSKSPL